MVKSYSTVKLPSEVTEAIKNFIASNSACEYSGVADFVKDAVRHHYCWSVHKIRIEPE